MTEPTGSPPGPTNRRTPGRTNRRRADAVAEITEIAGRQLARDGIDGLSLRAIARQMGMVPSGIYRHVSDRDQLLTLLVTDGYRRLADAVEAAIDPHPLAPRTAFLAACRAVRDTARADPHRHALLYGTPVPGYAAPPETTVSAERLYRALLRPIATPSTAAPEPVSSEVRGDGFDPGSLQRLSPGIGADRAAAALDSWATLFGHLSLELFGHHRGTVTDPDRFFERAMEELADRLGLTDPD